MIDTLLERLAEAGIEPTSEELLDALWLAGHIAVPPRDNRFQDREALEDRARIGRSTLDQADRRGTSGRDDRNGDMYAAGAGDNAAAIRGVPVRSPGVPALREQRELANALRAFGRRVPSRSTFVVDEQATATRIAEEGLWLPVLRPAPERWLGLILVLDNAPSMVIWHRTVTELWDLAQWLGVFRDVRVRTVDSSSPTQVADPLTGIDLTRQAVVLLTDGVGMAWRENRLNSLLRVWGHRAPTAVITVLPQRMWAGSAIAVTAEQVHVPEPGIPNAAWRATGTVRPPVPVFALSPRWLRRFAELVTAAPGPQRAALLAPATLTPHQLPPQHTTAAQIVHRFRLMVSPTAFRLACCLSATWLSLPTIRLVQRVMLPDSDIAHLAEFFLGGLLLQWTPADDPDTIEFEFRPGVREELNRFLLRDDATLILRETSNFVSARLGSSFDFAATLADPEGSELPVALTHAGHPLARIAARVIARMGGRYRVLAKRLMATTADEADESPGAVVTPPHPEPVPVATSTELIAVTTPERRPLPNRVRIHALAKLLGTTSRLLLTELNQLGIDATSPHSTIDRATAETIRASWPRISESESSNFIVVQRISYDNNRFVAAARQLTDEAVTVRLSGVQSLITMADESRGELQQHCIDVLCTYLRRSPRQDRELGSAAGDRALPARDTTRFAILEAMQSRLRSRTSAWPGLNFDLRGVRLHDADFSHTRFSGRVQFDRAEFSGRTDFTAVHLQRADFDAAMFADETDFSGATFGFVRFSSSHFGGTVSFEQAAFEGEVHFDRARFMEHVIFSSTAFQRTTVFSTATFDAGADFSGTSFTGETVFYQVKFGTRPVRFDEPRRWSPAPHFDWDSDPSRKPANITPAQWPPTPAARGPQTLTFPINIATEDDLNAAVALASQGNRVALGAVLEHIRPLVVRYCRARIGAPEQGQLSADIVAQEVCLAAMTALPRYQDQGRPFMAFVYGIASHRVADAHRNAARHTRAKAVAEIPEVIDVDPSREQPTLDSETSRQMNALLAALPDHDRQILILRLVMGLSTEEAAVATGSTVSEIRLAQHEALQKLKTIARTQHPNLDSDQSSRSSQPPTLGH